jgi:hypothetical protein
MPSTEMSGLNVEESVQLMAGQIPRDITNKEESVSRE